MTAPGGRTGRSGQPRTPGRWWTRRRPGAGNTGSFTTGQANTFANLTAILAAAGADLSDVVRVGIFMRDLQRDRPAFNQAWVRHFVDHRPARSAVEVKDFGRAGESVRYMVEAQANRG